MATTGSFNKKTPTMKRIMKEAAELSQNPSADYHATPLESNIFEWHFTLRGPPSPSPFAGGIYHGRITLPPTYPLRPPSFRFLTPSGRFEVNREICLSISGFHEESWQPAWGVRTALLALRGHMDVEARGQVGGIDCDEDTRRRLARQSTEWMCAGCGRSNRVIMEEQEKAAKESGAEGAKKEEKVPEELRLAYREDLGKEKDTATSEARVEPQHSSPEPVVSQPPQQVLSTTEQTVQQNRLRRTQARRGSDDAWLDKAIYGIAAFLVFLVARKFLSFL
jgi:ubiquitin-conjugating enzyme E2 J1